MSVHAQERTSLEAALQQVGVLDAERKPLRGRWHQKQEATFVIEGIDVVLEGEELVLRPTYGTIWHGVQGLQEERILLSRGPAEFATALAACSQRKKTAQENHDRRVYGNEW